MENLPPQCAHRIHPLLLLPYQHGYRAYIALVAGGRRRKLCWALPEPVRTTETDPLRFHIDGSSRLGRLVIVRAGVPIKAEVQTCRT